MKKVKVLIITMILICFILLITQNVVSAYDWNATIANQAQAQADDSVVKSTKTLSGAVLTIVKIVCAAVAVIMLVMVAIKYMTAAPSERAEIKKHAIPYVVGAIIMFASTAILQIIQNFASSI